MRIKSRAVRQMIQTAGARLLALHRTARPEHPATRTRQLLRKSRLCFSQNVKGSRACREIGGGLAFLPLRDSLLVHPVAPGDRSQALLTILYPKEHLEASGA